MMTTAVIWCVCLLVCVCAVGGSRKCVSHRLKAIALGKRCVGRVGIWKKVCELDGLNGVNNLG